MTAQREHETTLTNSVFLSQHFSISQISAKRCICSKQLLWTHFWMASLPAYLSGLWTCVVTQSVHITGCSGQQNVEPKPLAYLRHMDGMATTSESMCGFMSRCSWERSADLSDDSSIFVSRSVWCGDSDSVSCEAVLSALDSGWNYTDPWLGYRILGIPTTARCRKHELRSCHMNDLSISIRRRMLVTLFFF
jgi:hypothetical protein